MTVPTSPGSVPPLDGRALVEPVDRAAVRAYQRSRTVHGPRSPGRVVLGAVVGTILGALALAVVAAAIAVVLALVALGLHALGVDTPLAVVPWLAVPAAVVTLCLVVVAVRRGSVQAGEQTYRLSRFAAANGFDFEPSIEAPDRPGMLFGVGRPRTARDVVRTRGARPVEVAAYSYQEQRGKAVEIHVWWYAMVTLDRALPHLVVETRRTDGSRGAPAPHALDRSQELELDGELGGRVRVSCLDGAQDEARAVLSPDVLGGIVEAPVPVSVEVVDDRLFLYSRQPLVTLDPATWEWVLRTAGWLSAQLGGAHAALRRQPGPPDGRPATPVAASGRLRRRGLSWTVLLPPLVAVVALVAAALLDRA